MGSLGDSHRDESVGLERGEGSGDSVTPGQDKRDSLGFNKSLCRDGGEGRHRVSSWGPTPWLLSLRNSQRIPFLPGKSKLGTGVWLLEALGGS